MTLILLFTFGFYHVLLPESFTIYYQPRPRRTPPSSSHLRLRPGKPSSTRIQILPRGWYAIPEIMTKKTTIIRNSKDETFKRIYLHNQHADPFGRIAERKLHQPKECIRNFGGHCVWVSQLQCHHTFFWQRRWWWWHSMTFESHKSHPGPSRRHGEQSQMMVKSRTYFKVFLCALRLKEFHPFEPQGEIQKKKKMLPKIKSEKKSFELKARKYKRENVVKIFKPLCTSFYSPPQE